MFYTHLCMYNTYFQPFSTSKNKSYTAVGAAVVGVVAVWVKRSLRWSTMASAPGTPASAADPKRRYKANADTKASLSAYILVLLCARKVGWLFVLNPLID
jgi:hypothetical protein